MLSDYIDTEIESLLSCIDLSLDKLTLQKRLAMREAMLSTMKKSFDNGERAVLAKASQQVQGEPVQSLDERMKAAGMLSVSQLLAGAPMDAFHKHAGVVDLDSLLEWVEMRRGECLRAQARYDLDKPKDDLYEWAIAHSAVFTELHVNLRAAIEGEKTKATPAPKQESVGWNAQCSCGHRWVMDLPTESCPKCNPSLPQAAAIPEGWTLTKSENVHVLKDRS